MEPLTIKCSAFQMITPANSPKIIYVFMVKSQEFDAIPKINTEESSMMSLKTTDVVTAVLFL